MSSAATGRTRSLALAASQRGVTTRPLLRNRTRSLVSNVIAPPVAGALFAGAARDELVEDGAFVGLFAENPPEALHVLAHRAAAGEHDGHVRAGDVDAFVQ